MRFSVRAPLTIGTILAIVASLALALATPASAETPIDPGYPVVKGTAQYERTLTADPGTWQPKDVTFSYQWLRDGKPVQSSSTSHRTYELDSTYDIGKRFAVRVTARRQGSNPVTVTSARTGKVARATIANTERPTVTGTAKFRKTLTGTQGTWSRKVDLAFQWLRDDRPIRGADGRSYELGPSDVGAKIRFRVTATRAGFEPEAARSAATDRVRHRRSVREVVTYSVTTRGSISSSVAAFTRLAAQTYADPRGWRGMGIEFTRVKSGGDFTLVLSQASKVPTFSSACSSTYSCRVGRYVVINQTRWQKASPAWDANDGSLRNYRNLVINHETGHWFGKQHSSCSGKGDLAPVMQQQSKGLQGCKINPWPKVGELHAPRFGF